MTTVWDRLVKGGAAVCGAVMSWWAGLGAIPQTLAVFMAADYVSGILCAWKGLSPKTKDGALSSKAGFEGLLKKACILLVVFLAAQLDAALGTQMMAGATMCFYIANEGISILENTSMLNVPWPQALKDALETMRTEHRQEK